MDGWATDVYMYYDVVPGTVSVKYVMVVEEDAAVRVV